MTGSYTPFAFQSATCINTPKTFNLRKRLTLTIAPPTCSKFMLIKADTMNGAGVWERLIPHSVPVKSVNHLGDLRQTRSNPTLGFH